MMTMTNVWSPTLHSRWRRNSAALNLVSKDRTLKHIYKVLGKLPWEWPCGVPGMLEDLEDIKKEQMEKKRKAVMKKHRGKWPRLSASHLAPPQEFVVFPLEYLILLNLAKDCLKLFTFFGWEQCFGLLNYSKMYTVVYYCNYQGYFSLNLIKI